MKALFTTDGYEIPDFELVTGFNVRVGGKFTIALTDAPEGHDFSMTNDPALEGVTSEDGNAITITAKAPGESKLFVLNSTDVSVKRWKIQVYTDEAVGFRLPEPEIKDV